MGELLQVKEKKEKTLTEGFEAYIMFNNQLRALV